MKSLYDIAEEAYWLFDKKKKHDTIHKSERDTFKQAVITTFHAYPVSKMCKWEKIKSDGWMKTECGNTTMFELKQLYCQYCGGVIKEGVSNGKV